MNRKQRIEQIVAEHLNPSELDIMDESSNHRGRSGQESHFKLLIVSQKFQDMPLIGRHRLVKTLLEAEFLSGMHALSLHLLTPSELEKRVSTIPASPPCRGGE